MLTKCVVLVFSLSFAIPPIYDTVYHATSHLSRVYTLPTRLVSWGDFGRFWGETMHQSSPGSISCELSGSNISMYILSLIWTHTPIIGTFWQLSSYLKVYHNIAPTFAHHFTPTLLIWKVCYTTISFCFCVAFRYETLGFTDSTL
jgi:hypothetical protein